MTHKTCLAQILMQHLHRYPLMEPADVVKLLYQNEFGGGHLISAPSRSLAYLKQEWERVEQSDPDIYNNTPSLEDIGGGLARLHLYPARAEGFMTPEQINEIFVRSAAAHQGDMNRFREKLNWLEESFDRFPFAFSRAALSEYLAAYRDAGCPMVSHSEKYRMQYHPAYRVIRMDLAGENYGVFNGLPASSFPDEPPW